MRRTSTIDPSVLVEPAPARLAVCRFWDTALRAARGPLVAPLSELGPSLAWAQNPNYRRRPPDAAFLDNYGYAVIAGPLEGPPALVPEHASRSECCCSVRARTIRCTRIRRSRSTSR